MTNGTICTNLGRTIVLNRTFTASPTYGQPSLFKIGTGTATPTLNDTALTSVDINGGSENTKAIAAGYPILDETTKQATIRCILLTTEPVAQPVSLTEFGMFNNDATKKLFSRCVFTPITKTTQVQLIFVEKDRITT